MRWQTTVQCLNLVTYTSGQLSQEALDKLKQKFGKDKISKILEEYKPQPSPWPEELTFDILIYNTIFNNVCGMQQIMDESEFNITFHNPITSVYPLWFIQILLRIEHIFIMNLFNMQCQVIGRNHNDKSKHPGTVARLYLQQRNNVKALFKQKVWSLCWAGLVNGFETVMNVAFDFEQEATEGIHKFIENFVPINSLSSYIDTIYSIPYNADIINTVQHAVDYDPSILTSKPSAFWTKRSNISLGLMCEPPFQHRITIPHKNELSSEMSGGVGDGVGDGGGGVDD